MKLRTALVIAVAGGLTLACGGGGDEGAADVSTYTMDLTPPWTTMDLPIGTGNVVYSDGTSVTVDYPAQDPATVATPYRQALEGQGWALQYESADTGIVTVTYGKEGRTLTLTVITALDTTSASIYVV